MGIKQRWAKENEPIKGSLEETNQPAKFKLAAQELQLLEVTLQKRLDHPAVGFQGKRVRRAYRQFS